ncbi:MAG: WYL domain-containing protein [Gallionella sp.]|nr:WYL domain-containing protein [Gallionella sp.]
MIVIIGFFNWKWNYLIDQMLSEKKVVSRQDLIEGLGISWATLKRDLAYLKDRFNAPIIFDRDAVGYRFDTPGIGPKYELPGLWFNADETYALLAMHQMLSELEPGLLTPHVAPLLSRLETIVGSDGSQFDDVSKRVRLARTGARRKNPEHFGVVTRAILERKRIHIRHFNRPHNEYTERELSPQRMVFYRSNWYLECWCHTRKALRRFSLDAIDSVKMLNSAAKNVSAKQIEEALGGSYGIYGGKPTHLAVLRFSVHASRWVSNEEWHPDQLGEFDTDGRYVLKIPYADPTELMMDILRQGHHVEVLEPVALRREIQKEAKLIVETYK